MVIEESNLRHQLELEYNMLNEQYNLLGEVIDNLNQEYSGLSFFAFRRKKLIAKEIAEAQEHRDEIEYLLEKNRRLI